MILKTARRLVIFVIGGTIVLLGVAMIVTPGPAILVIPAGLAVLATEFVWARRLLRRFKTTARGVAAKITGRDAASRKRAAPVVEGRVAPGKAGSPKSDLPAVGPPKSDLPAADPTMATGPLRPTATRFGGGERDGGGQGRG